MFPKKESLEKQQRNASDAAEQEHTSANMELTFADNASETLQKTSDLKNSIR